MSREANQHEEDGDQEGHSKEIRLLSIVVLLYVCSILAPSGNELDGNKKADPRCDDEYSGGDVDVEYVGPHDPRQGHVEAGQGECAPTGIGLVGNMVFNAVLPVSMTLVYK